MTVFVWKVFEKRDGEQIELTHRAHTRDTFAGGALRAARFLADKEPGMYAMKDALGRKRTEN